MERQPRWDHIQTMADWDTLERRLAPLDRRLKLAKALKMMKSSHTLTGWAAIAVILSAMLLAGCQTAPDTSAEEIVCADPQIAQDKGGKPACLQWYSALRGPDDVCYAAKTEAECATILEDLETIGFRP